MLGCVDIYQIKWLQKINLSIVVYQVTRNQMYHSNPWISMVGKGKKKERNTTKHQLPNHIYWPYEEKPKHEPFPSFLSYCLTRPSKWFSLGNKPKGWANMCSVIQVLLVLIFFSCCLFSHFFFKSRIFWETSKHHLTFAWITRMQGRAFGYYPSLIEII